MKFNQSFTCKARVNKGGKNAPEFVEDFPYTVMKGVNPIFSEIAKNQKLTNAKLERLDYAFSIEIHPIRKKKNSPLIMNSGKIPWAVLLWVDILDF